MNHPVRQLILLVALLIPFTGNLAWTQTSKIRLGMTYEEVRTALGTPIAILRGMLNLENGGVESFGQAYYSSWYYSEKYLDTVKRGETIYLINGKSVGKELFGEVSDTVYLGPDGQFTFKIMVAQYRLLRKYPPGSHDRLPAKKRIVQVPPKPRAIIQYVYGVVFDAQSGRVVRDGFFPFRIEHL